MATITPASSNMPTLNDQYISLYKVIKMMPWWKTSLQIFQEIEKTFLLSAFPPSTVVLL